MIRWLSMEEAAAGMMKAIENVIEAGIRTKDLGGQARTTEVVDAVCKEMERIFKKQNEGLVLG